MRLKVSLAIAFALGAGTGVVGTYYYMRNKIDSEVMEETQKIKDYYGVSAAYRNRENDVKETNDDICEPEDPTDRDAESGESDISDDTDREPYRVGTRPITRYDRMYKGSGADVAREPNCTAEQQRTPYTISPMEFQNDRRHYEKTSVFYYEDDETLASEEDEVLPIETTIGYAALKEFGEYEDDVVYVRNELLEIDYEVIREHANFLKDVLGFESEG